MSARAVRISVAGDFKPGDPAPAGYLDWHEWAAIQHKAGMRQEECGRCGRWKFPQELSDQRIDTPARTRSGLGMTLTSAVCLECAAPSTEKTA
jgi:hypothetical protein